MVNIGTLLKRGENVVESYRVQLTEFANTGWISEAPAIDVYITDANLILLPASRETDHQATVLPLDSVNRVWHVGLGRRDGVLLSLTTGERMYMFVSWTQGRRLARDIRNLVAQRKRRLEAASYAI